MTSIPSQFHDDAKVEIRELDDGGAELHMQAVLVTPTFDEDNGDIITVEIPLANSLGVDDGTFAWFVRCGAYFRGLHVEDVTPGGRAPAWDQAQTDG